MATNPFAATTVSDNLMTADLPNLARAAVEQWSDVCQKFLDWQKQQILQKEPSQQALDQHRMSLKWLLRFAKSLYLTASDPEYPDKTIAKELRGRLVQLEHSWRIVHERMPEQEAETLLRQVFPE